MNKFIPNPPLVVNPPHKTDFYKQGHRVQYPDGTTLVFTNFTARGTRVPGIDQIVNFGTQAAIQKLHEDWHWNFFQQPKDAVLKNYARRIRVALNLNEQQFPVDHMADLWDLGYLPLSFWGLPEGKMVDLRVPSFCMFNTHPDFGWVTNFMETDLSANIWPLMTSATTAFLYRDNFEHAARLTDPDNIAFAKLQGHDFSYRGMMGTEAAMLSGAGHLVVFQGTDTIPALDFIEHYYDTLAEETLLGTSVWATEHSVMCMGTKSGEIDTFRRLLTEVYPDGILSVVSDTWNLWDVVDPNGGFVVTLKDLIESRDGALVIRPDSGDPVKILCGYTDWDRRKLPRTIWDNMREAERMGVVECLYHTFPGADTKTGFKKLLSCIGAIYGDSITLDRQNEILQRLEAKHFASTNSVLGIGSFTYQGAVCDGAIVTRDTHGMALKSTYGEVQGEPREIWKDPATDNGLKKSAKGLIAVTDTGIGYTMEDQVTWDDFRNCAFDRLWEDGEWDHRTNFLRVRENLEPYFLASAE